MSLWLNVRSRLSSAARRSSEARPVCLIAMAVQLPVCPMTAVAPDVNVEEVAEVEASDAAKMGIPPSNPEDDCINNVTVDVGLKKEPTLLTKKDSTSPIKKGSNSPHTHGGHVCPKEVTVSLIEPDHEVKALEVPVKKPPPSYGPNNSARRANRRKGEGVTAPEPRPSSPMLTPDSRSPASSRPASPFSPACSTPARRHSCHSVLVLHVFCMCFWGDC